MKKLILAATALLAIASCNSSEHRTGSTADTSIVGDTRQGSSREAMLEAFTALGQAVSDPSGAAFAEALPYPLADSVFFAYVEDEAYTARFEREGRVTTQALFRDYLPQISKSVQLGEFRQLFRHISANDLKGSDSVHRFSTGGNEPCRQFYLARIIGNQIELSYGSDHNDSYVAPDDEGEVCEWATIWFFRLDGRKLRLERMFQAG